MTYVPYYVPYYCPIIAKETLPGGTQRLYDYDELMRVANITGHGDYSYNYDNLYRLTETDNPQPQADEAYTYDGVGNRQTSAQTTGNWAYNDNNELEGYDDTSFRYDANGNMIEKIGGGETTMFFYNLEDRLERVENGSGNVIATYYYDPFGRRLWKDVGGNRTCFYYRGDLGDVRQIFGFQSIIIFSV